jgi:hypothetical protein
MQKNYSVSTKSIRGFEKKNNNIFLPEDGRTTETCSVHACMGVRAVA